MGTTATPNLNLIKPNPFEEEDSWAPILNTNWDKVDVLGSVSAKAIAAVTPAADRLPYFTSGTAAAVTALTSFARTILDDADAATARATLGAAGLGANTFTATQTINGAMLLLTSNSDYEPQTQLTHAGATAGSGAYSILNRARGTYGSPTIVASGDQLGNLLFQGYDGTAYRSAASIEAQVDGTPGASDMPGRLTFKTTPDGGAAATERMCITSAGDVGIGTSSPSFKLDVNGNSPSVATVARVYNGDTSGTAYAGLQTGTGSGLALQMYAYNGIGHVGTTSSNPLVFLSNNTERMQIDASGNVGIGGTPSARLHVNSAATDEVARFESTGQPFISLYDSGVRDFYIQDLASTVSAVVETNKAFTIATNNTERMRIDAAGAVTIGGSPVIAASGTAAQGDVLYHNGTAWVRLAAGTSGQFLKTNGAGANPAWANETVSGMTLLATLATTSGNSVPTGTLNLTPYRKLFISLNGISSSANSIGVLLNGITFFTLGTAASTSSAWADIDLATGIGLKATASVPSSDAMGITTATTVLTFTTSTGNFDAGSIQIYGVA